MTFSRSARALIAATLAPVLHGTAPGGDFDDAPDFAHAMEIRTEEIDGFPVVTHYGRIRPDFADRSPNPHRSRRPLDEGWRFRFDPGDAGIRENWATTRETDGWTPVALPHCWDMLPGGRFWDWSDSGPGNPPFYDGTAWYRCDFRAGIDESRATRLEFLGVPHRVTIFLNGEVVALHEGEGQPFSIDVTGRLRDGANALAVRITRLPNHRPKEDGGGFDEIDYVHTRHPKAPDNWPYAGIPRPVSLVTEDPAAIRKVQIRTEAGRLSAAVCLSNEGRKARRLTVALDCPAIQPTGAASLDLAPGERRVLRFEAALSDDAGRWSPASPLVHTLAATVTEDGKPVDLLRTTFGIRDFRVAGDRLLLNGHPVFLKGVAFYEEHPDRGNALLPADHERLFADLTGAGANFARLHVAQRHPLTYDLADRRGIMLCAEWGGFWYRERAMAAQTGDERSIYRSLARCALWDLANHPSVVLWGVHNECHQFCPEYEVFVKEAHRLVDSLDLRRRPVTWAAWHPHKGEPCFEHADVIGFNEYRGAMDPFEELDPDLEKVRRNHPGKPLVILENGGWSRLGNRGPKDRPNTEDWQADLLRRQHAVLVRHAPPLSGYTYWLLRDYRSRKPYTGNREADGWSRMGLCDERGRPKLVRDVFRSLEWPAGGR